MTSTFVPTRTSICGNPKVVHVMDFVADFIKEKRWQAKTIGVEKDAHYFTAHWFERLTAALPDAKFTDATNMVNFLRAVKSKQELDYMGIAARIVEKAMGNAIHMMEPGSVRTRWAHKFSTTRLWGPGHLAVSTSR